MNVEPQIPSGEDQVAISRGLDTLFTLPGMLLTHTGKHLVLRHISSVGPVEVVSSISTSRYQFRLVCGGVEEILVFSSYYNAEDFSAAEYKFKPGGHAKFGAETLHGMLLRAIGELA